MKFGDNLKRVRKMRKISQEELADKLGVSRQSVSKWETGENYPSMTNIMCLCTIFKCNINELVHEDMTDINSLDEEVKMSVVKFKEEKQKKVKTLSKIVAVISKIGWICSIIGISVIAMITIILPMILCNIDIKDNKIIAKNNIIEIIDEEDKLVLKHNDIVIAEEFDQQAVAIIKDVIKNNANNKWLLIGCFEMGLIVLIICLILSMLLFKHLEKLFNNINKQGTPFTLENVEHIKKIAYIMITLIILPNISGTIIELIIQKDLDITVELFNVVEILILFVISYIFEYGYEIQLDSNGKMYGDTNE